MFHGTSAPSGWLVCDGSTFSATDYPKLATVLGSTTLPDFRDRFPIGVGANALGATGGAATHTHSTPNHSHTFSSASNTATVTSGGAARVNGYTNIGAGTTGSASSLPPWRAIRFVIRAA